MQYSKHTLKYLPGPFLGIAPPALLWLTEPDNGPKLSQSDDVSQE